MVQVKVDGFVRDYPEGTTWLGATDEYQYRYENDILLVRINGKLQELRKYVENGKLKSITARDRPDMMTYQRSTSLIMLKVFYVAVGAENIDKIMIDSSLGKDSFVEARGNFVLDETLLLRVKNRMAEYTAQEISIMKRSASTDGAVELSHRHRMCDKERLFRYRRVSRVNIYGTDGFEGYYYGYMVQNTGYIKYFDLVPYHYGFILVMPPEEEPRTTREFEPKDKLSATLSESTEWGRCLDLETIGAPNDKIAQGEMSHLILIQEALQEKRATGIAAQIASRRNTKFMIIVGPSSSGRTTLSHRLSVQPGVAGLKPHSIAVDNYLINQADSPRGEQGNYNYEVLECLDIRLFNRNMTDLLASKRVELSYYSFKKGVRGYKGNFLQLGAKDILVIEGVHCFSDRLSHSLSRESKFKICTSALTQLNTDEHNRIPIMDGRLIRRMVRDARTRGSSARDAIRMWPSMRKGEKENIFPFQGEADAMLNSILVYESAVLKQHAESLLFSIPEDSEEYLEVRRFLRFLDCFIRVSSGDVPKNSTLREFTEGGCLNV